MYKAEILCSQFVTPKLKTHAFTFKTFSAPPILYRTAHRLQHRCMISMQCCPIWGERGGSPLKGKYLSHQGVVRPPKFVSPPWNICSEPLTRNIPVFAQYSTNKWLTIYLFLWLTYLNVNHIKDFYSALNTPLNFVPNHTLIRLHPTLDPHIILCAPMTEPPPHAQFRVDSPVLYLKCILLYCHLHWIAE